MQTIPLLNLAIAFIPALVGIAIIYHWSLNAGNALYAVVRMLAQLLLIGYLLTFIFNSESASIVLLVLIIMLVASSWIALGVIENRRKVLYKHAFAAIALGGGLTLALVTQGVLTLEPWYSPQFMIPLAGMIFSNSMNTVSLAAERLGAEMQRGVPYEEARSLALNTSLIPVINSLFAVGLVSLPGMMTGQILSGVSPLIATRYQIMVMCMILGSSCLSAVCFLAWSKPVFQAASIHSEDS